MRYPASEKLEIIRLVEQSHLPVKRTLEKLGIPRATFYRWYDPYQTGGAGGPKRPLAAPGSGLEPHPGRYPRTDQDPGPGRAGTVAPGAGGALHRHRKLFCVRGFGLPPAEGRLI